MLSFTTHPIILETARLYVSELSPEIYRQLITNGSDEEIMSYLGLKTSEELREEKDKVAQGLTTYYVSFKNFRLLDKETGKVIGRCDFHTWVQKHRRAEIGYHLLEDSYKQKGLMTEALGAILAYGFEHMHLYRVDALIASYNEASRRLLKHFNFTPEGTLRGHYVVDGISEDSLLSSLLLPEYEKLKYSWHTPTPQ
jgi:ribosomal-protein-alanine N-acetyltransferase